jgi:signal transduction histidine kinase
LQAHADHTAWHGGWFSDHPLPHLIYDPVSLRMLAANQAALDHYGFTHDALLTCSRLDLLWPDQWEAFKAFLADLPGAALGPQTVWRERTQAGDPLQSDVRGMPIMFGGQPARLSVVVEAGPRTALEEALRSRELADEARRRQSEFLSRMSHELRTPLNAILGFGALLERELAEGGVPRRQLRHIVNAGEQMLRLVDDLLQLQHLQQDAGAPQLVAMQDALADGVALLTTLAQQRQVRLKTVTAENLRVRVDPQRLQQVLMLVGVNALRASAPGGTVSFLLAGAPPGQVRLVTRHTGTPPEDGALAALFEPLSPQDPLTPRTPDGSLGLLNARELTLQMHGRLEVFEDPAAGARVVLTLPRAPA